MSHDAPDRGDPAPVRFETDDGLSLEGEVTVPDGARAGVVLAHPHPAQGGTMRSLVTSELFRLLPANGLATLRFNFRGVEGSQGTHDHGRREHLDIEAAIDTMAERAPGLVLVVAGWSFGADVALTVNDARLAGWALLAPPLRVVERSAMVAATDPRPKLLIAPERDQFNPPESARAATADWVATEVVVVAGADHFFAGRTGQAADLVVGFVDSQCR
jgi:uncharacterized protein